VGLLAAALAGCHGDQSMMSPGGPAAAGLAQLGNFVMILFCVVGALTIGILIWGAVRRRGTLEEHAPWDESGGHRWVLWGGFIIPVAILAVVFVLTLKAMDSFPLSDHEHTAADIRVIGHQWWWELKYEGLSPSNQLTTANELHIPVGQPVDLALESRDVIHSFWVPRLHGKVDLIPGRVNHLRLQADEPGVFEGQCSEFCGQEHAQMRLRIVAEPREAFAQWVRAQGNEGAVPALTEAAHGRELFETRACGLCHTVRGTRALGTIGPDLTHLASRRGIAANLLPNDHAYLPAWISRAQSFKPGAAMPDVSEFSGRELQEISEYLQQLE
jgi:cytochrome c oxidase subunit 2